MYATPDQIEAGMRDYIDSEFIARLSGVQKLAVLTAVELFTGKAAQMAAQFSNNKILHAAEVTDPSGRYEIDRIKQAVLSGMDRAGMNKVDYTFPILGPVTFSRADVEKLHQAIAAHV